MDGISDKYHEFCLDELVRMILEDYSREEDILECCNRVIESLKGLHGIGE